MLTQGQRRTIRDVLMHTRARARDIDLDPDYQRSIGSVLNQMFNQASLIKREVAPHAGFDYSLFYAWSYAHSFVTIIVNRHKREIHRSIATYSRLIEDVMVSAKEANLITITQSVPLPTASPQDWQGYADALFAMLQQRDLVREWHFSDEQIEKLNRYLAANELLVQCLKVATVTDRQAILNGVLEPPAGGEMESPVTEKPAAQAGKPWWKLW